VNFMRSRVSIVIVLLVMLGCSPASDSPAVSPDCPISKGTCSKIVGDLGITLDMLPKPVKAMSELDVYVRLDALPDMSVPDNVVLDLSMPGMYMGENKIVLNAAGGGLYKGMAVIPRCPSGSRLWKAKIDAGGVSAPFLFEVEDRP
jgi:hypothetical protein